jgi:hypothetical protein
MRTLFYLKVSKICNFFFSGAKIETCAMRLLMLSNMMQDCQFIVLFNSDIQSYCNT